MEIFRTFKSVCFLIFITVSVSANATPSNNLFYNVRDYGAKGDGTTLDTKTINASIDAAFAAGGNGLFPAVIILPVLFV